MASRKKNYRESDMDVALAERGLNEMEAQRMTSDEKNRNNRLLAEFVGFRFVPEHGEDPAQWHAPQCKCVADNVTASCSCEDACYWGEDGNPPDFYFSEDANALLLEALPPGTKLHKEPEGWVIFVPHINVMCALDFQAQERKLVIVNAALKYLDNQSKETNE